MANKDITRFPGGLNIRTTICSGGAAGDHTCVGVSTGDVVLSAIRVTRVATTGVISSVTDLTSEFTDEVTASNTINNTGGTSSSNAELLVTFSDQDLS